MKTVYTLTALILLTLTSSAKSYFFYTAKSSGAFDLATTWSNVVRNDGVQKDKYIIPSAFTVTLNDITLDDVEMQIFGTLNMGNNAVAVLGNNSVIEIMATGSIAGNGASQQIILGTVPKYVGNKNKTIVGFLIADKSTGTAPAGFSTFSLLAVKFTSFNLNKNQDNSITIKWSATNEVKNTVYQVEKSVNGNEWTSISNFMSAGTESASYSYTDRNTTAAIIYYRIKSVNADGSAVYAPVKVIRANEAQVSVNIFSANKSVNVELNQQVKTLVVKIANLNGQVISNQTITNASGKISVHANEFNAGIYVVAVSDNNGLQVVKKVQMN